MPMDNRKRIFQLWVLLMCLFFGLPLANLHAQPVNWTRISSVTGELPIPPVNDGQSGLRIVDLDNNGENDYVLTLWNAKETVVWYRQINGQFEKYVIDRDTPYLSHGEKFQDIDNDGDLDLIFGDASKGNKIYWWENPSPNYNPDTAWTRRIVRDTGANFFHDNIWGDFDGDGQNEFVSWNQFGKQLLLFDIPADPTSAGTWPVSQIFSWTSAPHTYRGADAADIDQDGQIDFVGGCSWFKFAGGTTFIHHPIDTTKGYSQVKAGQLISGGRPEVVCLLERESGPLNMYEWTGSAWQAHTLISNMPESHTLQLGDIDGDGNLDIMIGELGLWKTLYPPVNNTNARLTVLYGDGSGNFQQQTVFEGQGDLEGQLADIDGDGDLDIIAKPFRQDRPRIDIWLNHGSTPTVTVPNLTGLLQADAELSLSTAGLNVGIVTNAFSDTIPAGNIIAQQPFAGLTALVSSAVKIQVSQGPGIHKESFETYADAADPIDWRDSGENSSLLEDNSLFQVSTIGTDKVFGTSSIASNIHSHYNGVNLTGISAYEYSGRFMITSANGGIGVTFFSQYPTQDAYYRLRRYANNPTLHLSPHGTTVSGDIDTGISPAPDQWYRFRIQVQDAGTQTDIRARVWLDGASEPLFWQVQAFDNNATRLTSGTVGLWSYRDGSQYWDNLVVGPLGSIPMLAVPDVAGLSQTEAEANITAAGLSVGTISIDYNNTVAAGLVISQQPAAGQSVPAGTSVDLVISLGPLVMVDVPDVVGLLQAEAENSLTALGLTAGTISNAHSDTIPAGSVVSQNPLAGTSLPLASPVDLVISLGPLVMINVPDLIGLPQAEAESNIIAAGLTIGTISNAYSDTVTPGSVISQNPAPGISASQTSPVDLVISSGTSIVLQDFDSYADGANPIDWRDSGANSSLQEDNSLFRVFTVGTDKVFGTASTASNIHSHYNGTDLSGLSAYEYSGRFMITSVNGGIGVTFFSQYPTQDAYYRLRRYANNPTFHLSPHGTTVSGDIDTGISPAPNQWYRFRIQAEDSGTQTDIRARVWLDGASEPLLWQVQAFDNSATRLTSGTVGLWSYQDGTKYWDNLVVSPLGSTPMLPVPDVVGLSQTVAEANISVAGLSAGTISNDYSNTVAAGLVISQQPAAGQSVPAGTSVDLVISLGPLVMVGVPDVVGLLQAEAENSLTALGLTAGTISNAHSDTIPAGSVVSQNPLAGTSLPLASPVDLVISLGPLVMINVPDLIGLPQAEAESNIIAAGLTIGTISNAYSDTVTPGSVISQNPAPGISASQTSPVDLVISSGTSIVLQDFDSYADGANPIDWRDSGANSSLQEDNSLFRVFTVGTDKVFGTASTASNIHSHYNGTALNGLSAYEYSGRFMITSASGGAGITIFSHYPTQDAYYRLRRYANNPTLHLSPHGTAVSGDIDTGISPAPNQWYRFRIQVEDTGTQTDIRARVWLDGTSEPLLWQVQAYDNSTTRLTSGTVGLWSYQDGSKYWDNLVVGPLP